MIIQCRNGMIPLQLSRDNMPREIIFATEECFENTQTINKLFKRHKIDFPHNAGLGDSTGCEPWGKVQSPTERATQQQRTVQRPWVRCHEKSRYLNDPHISPAPPPVGPVFVHCIYSIKLHTHSQSNGAWHLKKWVHYFWILQCPPLSPCPPWVD